MPKTDWIELGHGHRLSILYEDRSVMAIDKPAQWMLVPFSWQQTRWNLQAAITSAIAARPFWARSRNLKYLRAIHRLDADTTGILLLAKNVGALDTYGDLFESRQMVKVYLAVAQGQPRTPTWSCNLPLAPDPAQIGRMIATDPNGKPAETHFRLLEQRPNPGHPGLSLIEARPVTGRTHQIRVQLASAGHPVLNDPLYSGKPVARTARLALRAVQLGFADPFNGRRVLIKAPTEDFLREFGFPPK